MESNFEPPVSPKQEKTNIWYLVLAVVVLLALLFIFGAFNQGSNNEQVTRNQNIEVSKTDLNNTQGQERLPEGFPAILFIEVDGITESYTMNYKDRGVIQYSISFITQRPAKELFDEYESALLQNGYEVSIKELGLDVSSILATKDGDDFNLVVNNQDEGTVVSMSFLDR